MYERNVLAGEILIKEGDTGALHHLVCACKEAAVVILQIAVTVLLVQGPSAATTPGMGGGREPCGRGSMR